jgi:hypothetical protein
MVIGFFGWCAGGAVGAGLAQKQTKKLKPWGMFAGLTVAYPLWCWLTIPAWSGVAELVEVILKRWKT